MTIHRTPANWITLLALLAASLMLAGCGDDDPISPNDTYATADEDAAGVVATEIATDNGGMTDQIADLSSAVGGLDVDKALPGPRFQNAVYDETTGTWTLTVERERGDSEGTPYAAISRVYTLRFLYIGGQPQQYRIVGSDTARTVEFNIVSGTGTHRTRRFEQNLDALSADFTVTGVNTNLLTINGTYSRDASNRFETPRFVRTLTGAFDAELIDVTVPRGAGHDFSQAVSGTLSGTYVADITVERGEDYVERHIDRSFTITFGAGEATINMNGQHYGAHMNNGELND
ncbi:MAG: hypothetical protein Q7W56_04335 [Candidatus Latescibacteria bacterium]|nr:hypothetical protein [Candidatus Latescibacterota bacterium]